METQTADRRRAGRGRGRRRSRSRTRPPRRPSPRSAPPSPEQLDAAIAAAREAARGWAATPAVERAELLHEVAARMRALTDELARVMTLEGGKPLIENSDEVGWTAAAFDYYAEMGRNFAGRVIPSIESTQLALVRQGADRRVGLHRALELPAAAARLEARARRWPPGNTVVAKPSELTPLSTLMLAACFDHLPPGACQRRGRRRRRGRGDRARPARGRRGVHRLGGHRQEGGRARAPSAWRAMNLEMGGKDPFIVCADVAGEVEVAAKRRRLGGVPERRARCARRPSASTWRARSTTTSSTAFVEHARSLRVGDPLDGDTDVGPDGLGAPAREGGGAGRGRGGGRRRARGGRRPRRATSAATSTRPRWSPARRRRPTCCARRPSGRWRRSCRWTRSTRRSRWPTAPASGSGANVYTRDLETARALRARDQGRARSGSTTRSPTTTPARSAA